MECKIYAFKSVTIYGPCHLSKCDNLFITITYLIQVCLLYFKHASDLPDGSPLLSGRTKGPWLEVIAGHIPIKCYCSPPRTPACL